MNALDALTAHHSPSSELGQRHLQALSLEFVDSLGSAPKKILGVGIEAATNRLYCEVVELENGRIAYVEYASDGTTNLIIADDAVMLFVEIVEQRRDIGMPEIRDPELALLFSDVFTAQYA